MNNSGQCSFSRSVRECACVAASFHPASRPRRRRAALKEKAQILFSSSRQRNLSIFLEVRDVTELGAQEEKIEEEEQVASTFCYYAITDGARILLRWW